MPPTHLEPRPRRADVSVRSVPPLSAREGLGRVLPRNLRVEALVEHDSDAFLVCDFTGRIVFANPKAASVLGLAGSARLVGMSSDQLARRFAVEERDGTPTTRPAFPAMAAPDRVLRFRDPVVGWDRWTLVRTRPCAESHGTVLAVLHLLQDVTEEQRAQEGVRLLAEAGRRLTRSLSRDRILEHAAVVAVPRLGDEAIVLVRNQAGSFAPATWQIPGSGAVERAQALLRRCASTLKPLDAELVPVLVRYDPGVEGSSPGESILVLPVEQGGEVTAAIVLAMATNTGRIHHPIDLALGERFAELVASALANAALLEEEQRRRHSLQRRGSAARREAARGAALLRMVERQLGSALGDLVPERSPELRALAASLGELSRIAAGAAEVERSILDLREILGEALEAARPDLERSGQDPHLEAPGSLLVLGDRRCLVRAFASLLAIAAAGASGPGPLAIQAARGGSSAEVTLGGQEAAAPLVPLDDVLESFGVLSLAIDRQLIELHGGEIWAVAPDRRTGTAFRVQLPLA